MIPTSKPSLVLDDLDRQIVLRMRSDPRITNKALAEALNVTEVTVAARIKALEAHRMMRVVAQCDYRSLGYSVFTTVDVDVSGRLVEEVAQDLGVIEEVLGVSVLLGSPSLVLTVLAADLDALQTLLLDRIAPIEGVRDIRCAVITNVLKFVSGHASFAYLEPPSAAQDKAHTGSSAAPPGSCFDASDWDIIALLRDDGRTSNREVARLLNVSEGMVRQRLKKMESAHAMRLGLVADISVAGLNASAYVFIRAVPDKIRSISAALAQSEQCVFVGMSVGGAFDVVVLAVADSKASLAELVDNTIRMMPGVSSVSARELVTTSKHRYDIISII